MPNYPQNESITLQEKMTEAERLFLVVKAAGYLGEFGDYFIPEHIAGMQRSYEKNREDTGWNTPDAMGMLTRMAIVEIPQVEVVPTHLLANTLDVQIRKNLSDPWRSAMKFLERILVENGFVSKDMYMYAYSGNDDGTPMTEEEYQSIPDCRNRPVSIPLSYDYVRGKQPRTKSSV